MALGAVAEPPVRRRGSDYAQLSRRISQAGLLERRPGWYVARIVLTLGAFVAGWVAVFAGRRLVVAAARSRSCWRWPPPRSRSSATTPGTGRCSAARAQRGGRAAAGNLGGRAQLRLVGRQAQPAPRQPEPRGRGPGRRRGRAGLDARAGAADRAGSAAGWPAGRRTCSSRCCCWRASSLHVASIRAIVGRDRTAGTRTPMRHRAVEAVLLVAHTAGYVGAAVRGACRRCKALLFVAVHQGLWGLYMGCAFAPNHKGMPMPTAEDELDFLRKQVLTSRNVRGGRLVDLALGGLNYQIEHHLFPNMPRANLRRAQPIVRAYCAEQGIPYAETGLVESYRQALASPARGGPAAARGLSRPAAR